MKKIAAFLLCALLITLVTAPASHAVGETAVAKKGTPVIDGVVDEIWSQTDRVSLSHLKAGDLKANGAPADYSCYASMLWDEGHFYYLFEVTDDDIFCNNLAGSTWQNDCIFLYIDETNSKTANTWNAGQYQLAFLANGDSVIPRNGTHSLGASACTYKVTATATGFIVEAAFTPDAVTPAAGLAVGIDYQFNDANEGGSRDYCYGWSDETDTASNDASIWGIVTLSADAAAPAPEKQAAPETEEPQTPAEPAQEPAPETVAAQTSDITSVMTLLAGIAALTAFAVSNKKRT